MIYTKNNNRENPVLEGNTFSVCCKCGKEVPVPLNELFRAKKDHPLSAKVICPECTREAFVYIMHEERPLGLPSGSYVRTCLEGYSDFGFDERILLAALNNSRRVANEIR